MKLKKIIISLATLIIISIMIIVKIVNKEDKNKTISITEETIIVDTQNILNTQNIGSLTITNAKLSADNKKTKYSATITNKTSKEIKNTLTITFYENDIKTEFVILTDRILKSNEKTNIDITFEIDLNKITKIEYKIK